MEGTDFEDIVDAAGYGIHYWCDRAIVGEDYYKVHDAEEDDINCANYTVTPRMIEETWGKILDGEYNMAPYIRDYFRSGDVGDIDATAGDVLIQICCFGEIVYG